MPCFKLTNLRSGVKATPLDLTTDVRARWFGYMGKSEDLRFWIPCIQWTHCRDKFQDVPDSFIHTKGMWFCHGTSLNKNVCAFIDKVENRLNLKVKTFFRRTPYKNILWLQPSPFWVDDFIRRSFFTLCLRCGMRYKSKTDNFDYAMYEHYQTSKETRSAIKRFLNGYTFYPLKKPEYNVIGWNKIFFKVNEDKLKELLIKG